MRLPRTLAFAALLLAPALAGAQVHKCVDAEGHAKYTQGPCTNDAPAPKQTPASAVEPPTPERTVKVSPGERHPAAPAPPPDPDADTPLTDSMGRPDVTQMSGRKKP